MRPRPWHRRRDRVPHHVMAVKARRCQSSPFVWRLGRDNPISTMILELNMISPSGDAEGGFRVHSREVLLMQFATRIVVMNFSPRRRRYSSDPSAATPDGTNVHCSVIQFVAPPPLTAACFSYLQRFAFLVRFSLIGRFCATRYVASPRLPRFFRRVRAATLLDQAIQISTDHRCDSEAECHARRDRLAAF